MVLRKNNDKYDKFDGAEEFIQIKTEEIYFCLYLKL